ncbi:hypothetical protein GH714_033451 [Hevea brasiliensis]|uniref:Uncharacterized protein n=1 Tax=Hevea brasiliensis TaxID=3981 RepID=A0A6A6MNA2_HEVBR|nr:hypothetical protein GH714_033451 [Hevea brasiliensis]
MHPAEPSLSDIISKTESLSCTEPMLELIGSDDSSFHVTDNKLVARIIDVKERNEVLEEEPWLLDNNLLILKKWPPDKSFQALDFSTMGFGFKAKSRMASFSPVESSGHIARNCNGKLNGDIAPPSRFGYGCWQNPQIHTLIRELFIFNLILTKPRQGIEIATDNNNHQIETSRKEKISFVYQQTRSYEVVERLTQEQIIEIISMGLKRDRPTSYPQPSQNTTCSKAPSLWALRKRDDQVNLAQLQIKKQKLLDPAIVIPKPLDFLLHLAASLLKPKRIITGPNAQEIATILNIDESSNLFPQKDSATDSFLMIESTAGHNSRNLESLLPEYRVLKIPNFPPASKTQKSTWKQGKGSRRKKWI